MQKKQGRGAAGHLSRLKPVELDPLAEYGLPSKGEKRLLSPKVQESYYTQITARYLAFCTAAGDRDNLQKQFARLSLTNSNDSRVSKPSQLQPLPSPLLSSEPEPVSPSGTPPRNYPPKPSKWERPPSSSSPGNTLTDSDQHLAQIFSALRKLREAIVASNRRDHFAVQVYLFSARLGILASAYETYYPALLHLVRWLPETTTTTMTTARTTTAATEVAASRNVNDNGDGSIATNTAPPPPPPPTTTTTTTLTSLERQEVVGYLVLDAACRRGDLASAYRVRNEHRALLQQQQQRDGRLLDAALRALTADNWVAWRRVRRQADGYRARLMALADARVVVAHTLRAFARAYHSVPLAVLEEQTGCQWDELRERFGVGWELDEAGNVVIRKVKGR
ncbi:hypothetical protein C7999DRAFT_31618 [Corynascus novoguineensis]|uniref:Uncharacterized protein n=1 Tax=Corynascus novoguineensis TaxID=1126955 RepID=A0AAN7HQX4_9PEZI|nr:hypothetical protein C7999DRAFT_31618 [Corynascus novoguineensis]